jgi:hypothetical protein
MKLQETPEGVNGTLAFVVRPRAVFAARPWGRVRCVRAGGAPVLAAVAPGVCVPASAADLAAWGFGT